MEDTSKKLFSESRQITGQFVFAGITLFILMGIAIVFLSLLAIFLAYYIV